MKKNNLSLTVLLGSFLFSLSSFAVDNLREQDPEKLPLPESARNRYHAEEGPPLGEDADLQADKKEPIYEKAGPVFSVEEGAPDYLAGASDLTGVFKELMYLRNEMKDMRYLVEEMRHQLEYIKTKGSTEPAPDAPSYVRCQFNVTPYVPNITAKIDVFHQPLYTYHYETYSKTFPLIIEENINLFNKVTCTDEKGQTLAKWAFQTESIHNIPYTFYQTTTYTDGIYKPKYQYFPKCFGRSIDLLECLLIPVGAIWPNRQKLETLTQAYAYLDVDYVMVLRPWDQSKEIATWRIITANRLAELRIPQGGWKNDPQGGWRKQTYYNHIAPVQLLYPRSHDIKFRKKIGNATFSSPGVFMEPINPASGIATMLFDSFTKQSEEELALEDRLREWVYEEITKHELSPAESKKVGKQTEKISAIFKKTEKKLRTAQEKARQAVLEKALEEVSRRIAQEKTDLEKANDESKDEAALDPSSQPSVILDPVEEDNSYDFTPVRESLLQEQYRILAKAENALKKKAWHESVKDCSLAALETIQDIYKDMTDRPLFYGSHFLRLYQAQNFWFFFVEKLSKVVLKEKTPVQDPCA